MFCGVSALVQMYKLYRQEARYHWPVLELSEAEVKFVRLRPDEK